jgi:hypothetical protein
MRDDTFIHNTWCPIAGFRALKIFLAFPAEYRQRVYQLDCVAAFLRADAIGRKFTKVPRRLERTTEGLPQLTPMARSIPTAEVVAIWRQSCQPRLGRDKIKSAYQSRDGVRTTTKRRIDLHQEDRK